MDLPDRITNRLYNTMDAIGSTIESSTDDIVAAADILFECLMQEGKVLTCGNGASSNILQHFSTLLLNQVNFTRPALPTLPLINDPALLTGIADDNGFSEIYRRQIEAYGKPEDVLLLVSANSPSDSLVQAAAAAIDAEIPVIALLGNDTSGFGQLEPHINTLIKIPYQDSLLIHEAHLLVLHSLCDLIEYQLFGDE
ncbi:MAG: D-sedoheptulose-7-phosphate isomerase [Pontibacterium sp.]